MRSQKFLLVVIAVLFAGGFWLYSLQSNNEAEASQNQPTSENASKNPKGKSGVQFFDGSWEEAKEKAKDEGMPIFVDAYTTWCGPCKMMNRRVFPRKQVGKFYNENFINFKFDMESKNGKKFRRKYRVKGYPSFYYFDQEGDNVHSKMGYLQPKQLVKHGKKALNKIDG